MMNKENRRTIIVLIGMCTLFISLIVYISYFQIFQAEAIKYNSYNKRLWINEDKTKRGSIMDRNGELLVYSQEEDGVNYRHYNYGRLYSHSIGYSYKELGKAGLELKYNNTLLDISENQAINEFKNIVSDKKLGNDLVLTLDHGLQSLARKSLEGKKGSVIAMNPKTGEIYSMVSAPDFDADNLVRDWKDISEEPNSPLINRGIQATYVPGSIFKIIPAIALLEEGSIDKTYNCTGETTIDGYKISDYNKDGHGEIGLEEALIKSCNTYFAEKSLLIGKDKMGEVGERFLINKNILFDLPVKVSQFPYKENLGKTDIAASAYGQGKLEMTPLNMMLMASAIGNRGDMIRPTLIKRVLTSDGRIRSELEPKLLSQALDPRLADEIKEYMVGVVERGTGKSAGISGVRVAGKTGTAETSGDSHAWFIGFAPADDPKVAVVVFLEEEGSTGGSAAAPIGGAVMKYAIDNIKD